MKMDRALLIDFETNGVDPAKNQVVECAMILFSLKHAKLISAFSFLVVADHNEAEKINGIPHALVAEHGIPIERADETIRRWMTRAEVVLAHVKEFDRGFVKEVDRQLRPWVCTAGEVEWPNADRVSGSRVTDLCLAHGIGVTQAHRALPDVMYLAQLLERAKEMGCDLEDLIRRAMRPRQRYHAVTGRFDPSLNEKLKTHGFRWSPAANGRPGAWWRDLVVEDAAVLQASFPFAVVPVES